MKLPALQLAAVLILSSLPSMAIAGDPAPAASCSRMNSIVALRYSIRADSVPNVPNVCGTLWSKLKRFKHSCYVSGPSCEEDNGGLSWVFWVPIGCNTGMVHSAWWEATKDEFGTLDCPGWNQK